jgi:ferredoxin-NADP reductase
MHLTLIEKHPETNDVVSFIFQPQEPTTWIAGQFLTLVVPHENPDSHGTEHYFTISAAPYEGHIQITTRLTGSTFKDALNALPIGDTVEAKDIDGDFTLQEPKGQYVFIAGGIGITPFHSIIKQLVHEEKHLNAQLIYGNRDAGQIVFKQELEAWAAVNPDFTIQNVISPQMIDEETIRSKVPDLQAVTFYVSGPEPMVEALEKTMAGMGIQEDRMIRDYFPGYDRHNF